MHIMRHYDPRKFPSDAGFEAQVVRQVRSLHGIAMGRTVTLATGKERGWYKTLPIQTTQAIASLLRDSYAKFVAHIMASEQREQDRKNRIALDLTRGFEEPEVA
jgi:hypothetical protein